MKLKKNKNVLFFFVLFCVSFFTLNTNAQTPGVIVEGLPNAVLDPNGDGYVSLPPSQTPSQFTNIGFPANILPTDVFDVLYSEIAYVGIPEITSEPTGDPSKGSSCSFTDLVQDANSRSSYYNTDGTNMRFRFRLGGAASNSKGYSILIDTDEKFGFSGPNADPDAVPGNPGFEIEIVLRTNFEVNAYDVNDPTNIIELAALPYTTHAIKSLALTTICNDPDYFYDFYIPFSNVAGIDSTTKLRMVSLTSVNPKGIIGNNGTADIAGVDDSSNTSDNLYIETINTQTPTNGDPIVRASCPFITGGNTNPGAIINGDTLVQGTSTEEDGTLVEVFVNGNSTPAGTATVAGGTWSASVSALSTDDVITASATVPSTVASGVEKGTSIDNCDIETVLLTFCTPLATPVLSAISRDLDLTYATGTPAGSSFIFNFFDSNTGTQITTIDGVNVVNFVSTSATRVRLGTGSRRFTDEDLNFIVKIDTNPSTCQSLGSEPISTCSATGAASATPFLNPVEIGDTSLTGNFGGSPPTAATLRLIINNASTDITTTTSGSSNTFSFDISSLTLSTSDVIEVSNRDSGNICRNTLSTSISPTAPIVQSQTPTLNTEFCATGNISTVSGITNETSGTVTLYSKGSSDVTTSDTLEGTTTTIVNGTWTITGLSIAPSNYIAATIQATGKSVSDISESIIINSKTIPTSLTITSNPIIEGDASITGTSSGLPSGSIIQLYLDGDKAVNSSGNELTTTTDGSGNWTFAGLDAPLEILYTNAIVTVTATSTALGSCESDQSSSRVVICNPPITPTITAVSTTPICENSIFTVTVVNAQPGLLYQLLDQNNNSVGPSFLGPSIAADTTIDTDPIPFGVTSLKVVASKIFGTCTTVESNAISITVNPSPTITFTANPSAVFNLSAQTVDLAFSATTNSPNEYRIDFDDVAFTDVPYTALPASPIQITVPAGLTTGVYTATVTVREATNGCEKSYPITITITDASTPTITLTNTSVSLCSGTTTANFDYSATTNAPDQYSINFTDTANLQGFVDITNASLPLSPIQVTVPSVAAGGTYTGVVTVRISSSGTISAEYPITINVEKTNGGVIAGNQTVLNNTDVTAFTSVAEATGIGGVTYQWQESVTSATTGFTDISGATSATYDKGIITQTTYYKRIATSITNGCIAESNVITVTVITLSGIPMITQVYQVDNEKWIEITNTSTNTINANEIKVVLFKDRNIVFDGQIPDANLTITTALAPGQSVLIKNTLSTTITNINGTPLIDNNLTNIDGGNDIIILSTTTDATAWANRYDVVSNIPNKTSLVRIDETISANNTFTPNEWVTFIDDAILPYSNPLAAAQEGRHPHAPLISEITGSNTEANTLLGLHRIGSTIRTGSAWNNGFPDRSRFVIINEDYNHGALKLSARKLTVNNKLGIENLLVVTNDVLFGVSGEIRLIDPSGASNAQFIQTHTSASLVSGDGKLLVDQNSSVPSLYRYNYMGSPVISASGATTYTISDIFKDGTSPTSFAGIINTNIAKDITFLTGTNYDGDTTDPITLADYWMYTFASSTGGRSSWVQQRSGTPIPNSDGFIFKGPGRPQNYTFLGIPKDGTITTSVGASESYLVANPYTSAISVKEFIEDNISAITGTLYFWKHANEIVSSGIDGHFFAGYIGGYATRTITTGVTAKAENLSGETGLIDVTLEAEAPENTNSGELEGTAILLNSATDSITFHKIPRSVDSIRIRYQSTASKTINLKVNDVIKTNITLPSTSGVFSTQIVSFCVFVGSDITISSTNTDAITIDYLNLYDINGEVNCSPTSGDAIFQEPEAFIPIGQGFFVAGDADGGTITFDNSQREYKTEGSGSSVFFKTSYKSKKSNFDLPILKIGIDHLIDNTAFHRQLAISFGPFQSFDHDKGYDAEMFDIGDTDAYWKFPNNDKKYVIAGVQSIHENLEIPLEVTIDYSGAISFTLDQYKNFNDNIYIVDKLAATSYNIKEEKATITLEPGIYSDRFFLAFKPLKTLFVKDKDTTSLFTSTYVDNINQYIVVDKTQEIEIQEVSLYNLLGKEVAAWNIEEQQDKYQLKIEGKLPAGFYIVKLKSDKGILNKKVVIE
ncbi:T9SS C-terminal target domain-containing protein [Polaribacter sp. WD7]|uniref:T9SS type A sorting domain-containing protein n=1 Tax=Polaribacter sp. WD7 TaxID=2269061 RepID=UPI000DF401BD|nr:T9SS type A sorting domain-containing protein [Polaribacter sp. WD7]RCS26749.1 T9SS C-terminal target domain-containing protein [Polaribacter sp. WD7]